VLSPIATRHSSLCAPCFGMAAPTSCGALRALALNAMITIATGRIFFSEQFGDGWEQRWVVSDVVKHGKQGKFVASAGSRWVRDAPEDVGIMTGDDFAFYGISASFPSFSNADRPLIIQYQVKHDKEPNCGGAYLKLGPSLNDAMHFGDPTQFHIQFGPDTCGPSSQRTQLLFAQQGNSHLKKDNLPYKQEHGLSHLYRMMLLPNGTVSVDIDEESIYQGSLSEDWELPDTADVHIFDDIGFVGFDFWQMQGGTIFDNIIITDDRAEADVMSQKWRALHVFEQEAMRMEQAAATRSKQDGEM